MFGWGETKLQPCHVRDVAVAIPLALAAPEGRVTYEFGGPRVYTYKAILRTVAGHLERRPLLVPVPFPLWHGLAFLAEMLPAPPITRNQVELMRYESVAAPDAPSFARLGISPRPLEAVLPTILRTLAVTS